MPVYLSASNCSTPSTYLSSPIATPTALADVISVVHNSSQSFDPHIDSTRLDAVAPPVHCDAIQIPLYCKASKREGDRIDDLDSFSEIWGTLHEHLTTQILSEREVLAVLKSDFFQKKMGKNLVQVFIEALVRSTEPQGDMTTQRLREIFEVICHLPTDQWAVEFGEYLNFSRSTGSHGVAGFIQAQLTSSRRERDKRIAAGELLTDAQWQRLCEIQKQTPLWMNEGLTQADPNLPWVDLEDIPALRPTSAAAQLLLEKCLQVIDERRSDETATSEYANQLRQLKECITNNSDPTVLLPGRDEETVIIKFIEPTPPNLERQSDGRFPLLSMLEELERKSDFHDPIITANRVPEGLVAKAVYALQIVDLPKLYTHPESPDPVTSSANKALKKFIVKDRAVSPDNPPQGAIERESVFSWAGVEKAIEMSQQADALLTKIINTLTGWKPTQALDLPGPQQSLREIAETLEGLNSLIPAPGMPGSSIGSEGNRYAGTNEVNEANLSNQFAAFGASLGAWLHSAGAQLGSMGVTMLAAATYLPRQHPNASATLAFAAIHAALNEFYARWFTEQAGDNRDHFAHEADPGLRKQIIGDVQSKLHVLPEFVQTVRERREARAYANPHDDPLLVADIKSLMQQPVPSDPAMTVAELVKETVSHSREYYAHLQVSRMEIDIDGNGFVETEDIPLNIPLADSNELIDESAQWVLDTLSEAEITLHADRTLRQRVMEKLASAENIPMPVSTDSSIYKPARLFQEALNDPKVLAWFESKGFELSTVTIFSDWVSGNVTRNGVTHTEGFSIWDDSGWWQVSAQVLIAREVLDLTNIGLLYVSEDPNLIYRDVIVSFYGETPPTSEDEAKELSRRLSEKGWPDFDAAKNDELLDNAKALIHEEKMRAQLSYELEQSVKDLADDAEVLLSSRFSRAANNSPLDEKCSNIVSHLNSFLSLPSMVSLCQSLDIDCTVLPMRITEGRIQALVPPALWRDITRQVKETSGLAAPFNDLLQKVKDTGNALYSTLSFDLRQTLDFRGFGSPRTAGEIRNVIRWLRSSLPTALPLGDYGASLLASTQSSVTFTPAERKKVIALAERLSSGSDSIVELLGAELSLDHSIESRRKHAEITLEDMLTTMQSSFWAQQIIQELGWYGASEGQSASIDIQQQLLLAAIKLTVDPDATGKPGVVAGYDIYQPQNLGRDVKIVRTEIEQHLIRNKGVSEKAAPLIAHLFLVEAAPEFLLFDFAEEVQVGTANWMTLRLGVAIAEVQNPGCSRAMTTPELMGLALLQPVSSEQKVLFQTLAVDIIVIWGVMNGIIPQHEDGSYSTDDYALAASKFSVQRADLAEALEGLKRDLETREEIASRELEKIYGPLISTPIADIKVRKGSTEKSFVDAYMDGDLSRNGWQMSNVSMSPHAFNWFRLQLPDLNAMLTTSVEGHFDSVKKSFMTATKSLIARLPLEERQAIEHGEIRFYTLREETGQLKEDETPEIQAAFRGLQGTLLRCEHEHQVSYYEVFPGRMALIKRTDLPNELPLNGVIKTERAKISKGPAVRVAVQRGTELPFDFSAYRDGTEPQAGATSKKLIIEPLGNAITTTPVPDGQVIKVPDTYFSNRTADIAGRIVNGNFLQGYQDFLFKKAKGQTSEEENREYWAKIKNYLLQLIPFVGCIEDLMSGKRMQMINGAFGCFADVVSGLNTLIGGVGKISNVLKSVSPISIKAFDAFKISGTTIISMINPLDGLPSLLAGGGRTVLTFGKALTTGVFTLTEAGVARLQTCVERLRGFFGGVAGGVASRLPRQAKFVGVMGRLNDTNLMATLQNDKWYVLDQSGSPVGRALENFGVSVTAQLRPIGGTDD